MNVALRFARSHQRRKPSSFLRRLYNRFLIPMVRDGYFYALGLLVAAIGVCAIARWRVNLRGGADVEVTRYGHRQPMRAD